MTTAEVNARIVYWGIEDAGKTANLQAIHARLRPDHRGPLEEIPTRLDPSVCHERLMIELGQIAGQRTQIEIITVPGSADHAITRKQLLDQVDGIVFVVDARRECIDQNLASFEELRQGLAAYGRRLETLPLVVQYNKRDLSDPYVLEELHRKLELRHAAVFEATATEGSGVLQTLTTISKRVVRALRDPARADAPPTPPPSEPPAPQPVEVVDAVETVATPADVEDELDQDLELEIDPAPGDGSDTPLLVDENLDAIDEEMPSPAAAADPADNSDHVATRAQAMLDASWDEVARDVEEEGGEWRIVESGSATVEGDLDLSIPVTLEDEGSGRRLRLRLGVSLQGIEFEEPDL